MANAMLLRSCIPTALLLVAIVPLVAQNAAPVPDSGTGVVEPKTAELRDRSTNAKIPERGYTDVCEAHATTVDFDTCYADQFRLFDQDLNRLYRNTLLALQGEIGEAYKRGDQNQIRYDTTAIANLKAAQAAWVKYRDLQCSAAGQQFEGGSVEPIIIHKCMILVTRHRIDEIRITYAIGGRKIE
jgi:uncharacterized protein YecT (DUF1311 family)